jgi:hypothetical protein
MHDPIIHGGSVRLPGRLVIGLAGAAVMAITSGTAMGFPGVVSPPEGGTVSQATDAIVLEPHDGFVFAIWIATRPETQDQVLGQPPGTAPQLYWWSSKLGGMPGAGGGGIYKGATRYLLSQAFTVKKNTSNVSYAEYVKLTPGQRYYYQVEWNSISPGMGLLSPVRSFVVAGASSAPQPSASAPAPLAAPTIEAVRASAQPGGRIVVRFRARPAASSGSLYFRLVLRGPASSRLKTGTWSGTGSLQRQERFSVPSAWAGRRIRVALQVWNAAEKNTAQAVVRTTSVRTRP